MRGLSLRRLEGPRDKFSPLRVHGDCSHETCQTLHYTRDPWGASSGPEVGGSPRDPDASVTPPPLPVPRDLNSLAVLPGANHRASSEPAPALLPLRDSQRGKAPAPAWMLLSRPSKLTHLRMTSLGKASGLSPGDSKGNGLDGFSRQSRGL